MTRRLLATLSSIPSSSSALPPNPFTPPYAHSNAPPRSAPSSLRPPYAHSLAAGAGPSRINAPYRFSIPTSSATHAVGDSRADEWAAWAKGLIASDTSRERVMRAWEETLEGLTRAKSQMHQIPEVPYSALSEHLSASTTVDTIRASGSVIVRDVVPDSLALRWASDIWAAMEQRGGDAVYWHPALLEARSNVSIRNTSSSVLSALTAVESHTSVLAESAREGLGSGIDGKWMTGDIHNIWATNTTEPSTPLLSHLALTPPTTGLALPYTSLTATYALLRPLFRPVRSRISCYSSATYLESSNWALAGLSDISAAPTHVKGSAGLPHIAELPSVPIRLNPGDMILRNSLIPALTNEGRAVGSGNEVAGGEGTQALIPLSLLPETEGNMAYVKEERKAYEAGMPPPLVVRRGGMWGERGAVRVEQTGVGI